MKTYDVELFILGLPPSPHLNRHELIEANSQDEAEQIAHNKWVSDGWGVLNSKEVEEEM